MATAYIGLGSNLSRPIDQVRAGIAALAPLVRSRCTRGSSLYRTAPVGNPEQPDFINAVCRIETDLSATQLMAHLLALEHARGRERLGPRGGPRVLDLDLLLYDDACVQSPELTVPHPRMHERAFVLYPLHEIEPQCVVPGRGPVAELIARLAEGGAPQIIERLANEPLISELL